MIAAPIDYYVLPFTCALLGALLGQHGRSNARTGVAVVALVIGLLGATATEVLWHEPHVLQEGTRGGILAIALAIAIPTILTFVAAWTASTPRHRRSTWVMASTIAGVIGIAVYPLCGIYFYCVIVRDCL